MASIWTNKAKFLVLSGGVDVDTSADVKIMLLKNSYTPSADHNFVSDIVANECDATNYTGGFNGAGRKALASRTVTEDDTGDLANFDAADPSTYTALGGAVNNTLRYAAIIREVTDDTASPVLFILDMGSDKATNGGDFIVQYNSSGIAAIT